MRLLLILPILLILSCASTSVMYVQGEQDLNEFVKGLKKDGISYQVEKKSQGIYEIRYKEKR